MNRRLYRLILCITWMASMSAYAVPWQELTEAQRATLGQFEEQWGELDGAQQQRLALGADRWVGMDKSTKRDMLNRCICSNAA